MSKYTSDLSVGEIEKNIPYVPKQTISSKYPFSKMEIGDSFLVDIGSMKYQYIFSSVNNCFKNFKRHDEKYLLWKISLRRIDDKHIRIWRVE
jgi:hypothetical protein